MNRLFLYFAAGGILYFSTVFIVVADKSQTFSFVAELKLQRPTFGTIATPQRTVIPVPRTVEERGIICIPSYGAGFVPKTIGELAKAPADNAVWQIRPLLLKTGPGTEAPDLWSAPAEIFIGKTHWK